MKHYLTKAVEAVTIYRTPEKLLKIIEREILIKNPPYDVNNYKRR